MLIENHNDNQKPCILLEMKTRFVGMIPDYIFC